MERILTRTASPAQRGLTSNSNDGILHIPQNSRIGASPLDGSVSYPGYSFWMGVLPLCWGTVGVLYSPSRRSGRKEEEEETLGRKRKQLPRREWCEKAVREK